MVGCDVHPGTTGIDVVGGRDGFGGTNVFLTEEELTVEIGDVDCVCGRTIVDWNNN